MLELSALRKIDPELSEYSDAQLEEIRTYLYQLAQLSFECWVLEKSDSKNLIGSLTSSQKVVKVGV